MYEHLIVKTAMPKRRDIKYECMLQTNTMIKIYEGTYIVHFVLYDSSNI